MTGDQDDFMTRLRRTLPPWFGDMTAVPVLTAVLTGIAWLHASLRSWIAFAARQIRLATADGEFLDALAVDFLGDRIIRRTGENDPSFRRRVSREILRPKVTRQAMSDNLADLTGYVPDTFEPFNATDSKGWNTAPAAWNGGGAWGSLQAPHQAFVTAYRPVEQGVSGVAGWDTAPACWGHGSFLVSKDDVNGVSDEDICQTVVRTKAAGKLVWLRIRPFSTTTQPPRLDLDFILDVSALG